MKGLSKKEKKILRRIIVAAVLLLTVKLLPEPAFPVWPLYLIPYLIIGYDVLRKAGLGVVRGQVFDENFLMAIATVGAFGTGTTRKPSSSCSSTRPASSSRTWR